jgi:hypothetical protein
MSGTGERTILTFRAPLVQQCARVYAGVEDLEARALGPELVHNGEKMRHGARQSFLVVPSLGLLGSVITLKPSGSHKP